MKPEYAKNLLDSFFSRPQMYVAGMEAAELFVCWCLMDILEPDFRAHTELRRFATLNKQVLLGNLLSWKWFENHGKSFTEFVEFLREFSEYVNPEEGL